MSDFLQGCGDAERQLLVLRAFSSLSNQGQPVAPPSWRLVQHLAPAALRRYVAWLQDAFLTAPLATLLDFSTKRQRGREAADT